MKVTACFGSIGIVREFVATISPYKGALVTPHPLKAERARDTVYLRDGGVTEGVVEEVAGGKVKLKADKGVLLLEQEKVEKITFSRKKEPPRGNDGREDFAIAAIRLGDGSAITGEIVQLSGEAATLRVPYFSQEVKIPLGCIHSVRFLGEKHTRPKQGYKMPEFSRPIPLEAAFLPKDLGFIRGRVTTQGGKPLTGCLILFYDVAAKRLYGEDNIFHMLTHTVDGRYASPPLKPGRYVVIAIHPLHDGAVRVNLAPDVSVKAGEITTADLSMFWWYDTPGVKRELPLVDLEAIQRTFRMAGERGDDWIKAHHDNLLDFEGWW